MNYNLNNSRPTIIEKVGSITDGSSQLQDQDYGAPYAPITAPTISGWNASSNAGSFIENNQVSYAVSFVNAQGEESQLGPWSDWTTIVQGGALPTLVEIPTDATAYVNSPTTGRNIYRKFNLQLLENLISLVPEKVGEINDNETTSFSDSNWGAPMPPASSPSIFADSPWAQPAPSGGFVSGNYVYYAVSFVNSYGQSLLSPWSEPTLVGAYALPLLQSVPIDLVNTSGQFETTERNIFRVFSIGDGDNLITTSIEGIGSIQDNSTTTFQDNSYGAPNQPLSAPTITDYYPISGLSGSFQNGNFVSYAISYVAEDGSESSIGPWSDWYPCEGGNTVSMDTVIDPTNYFNNPNVSTNVYRRFKIVGPGNTITTKTVLVGSIDRYTSNFTDTNIGAPMPPTMAPFVPGTWLEDTPSGAFVAGNQVYYAYSYVSADGQESALSPWSSPATIAEGQFALPLVTTMISADQQDSSINVYRMFSPVTGTSQVNLLERTPGMTLPMQGEYTIHSIKCIKPSSGVANSFYVAMSAVETAAIATIGVGAVIAAVTAAPTAGAGAGAGAVIVAIGSVGAIVAAGTIAAVYGIGHAIDDDVYIAVNGTKVWPTISNIDMGAEDVEMVNVTNSFQGSSVSINVFDLDLGDDDLLADFYFDISKIQVGESIGGAKIQLVNESEGCIYELVCSVKRTQ